MRENYRGKVPLKQGHSIGNWYAMMARDEIKTKQLSGLIPLSEIKKHNKKDDAWTIFRGKVFDISKYMNFHPGIFFKFLKLGGDEILLQVVGRDCTNLHDKYHQWVNSDYILSKCFVGYPLNSGIKSITATLKKITPITSKISSFTFELSKPIFLLPGQNVTFSIRINDNPKMRTWTITDVQDSEFEITIKKEGLVTTYVHEKFEVGTKTVMSDIEGTFSIFLKDSLPKKILLVSAGIGITPMLAMLRQMNRLNLDIDTIFIHTDKEEIPFHKEFLEFRKNLKKLKCYFYLTQAKSQTKDGFIYSRIKEEDLQKILKNDEERETYLCGPKNFMDNMQNYLFKLGISKIYIDDFDL